MEIIVGIQVGSIRPNRYTHNQISDREKDGGLGTISVEFTIDETSAL